MKRNLLALVFCSLLLVGCTTTKDNSFSGSSTQNSGETSSEANSSGTSQGSNGSSNQSSGGNSSSDEDSSEDLPPIDTADDLGTMTVAQAREYIINHASDIELNSGQIGIDYTHKMTIKAYALDKVNLVKTTKNFGLNVSEPTKVIMGDHTSYISCASKTGEGTLYKKVADYAGQDTSRYEVTGFPSMYRGQPEIYVPLNSYVFNEHLDITKNIDAYVDEQNILDIDGFYNRAKDMNYNCAGHGYEEIVKINNLTCYDYVDEKYLFTNGTSMIKVLKNRVTAITGKKYNIIGLLTIKNYSPAISAYKLESVAGDGDALDLSSATVQGASALRAIPTPKDDTNTRYDSFVMSFKNIYKADAYMHVETHGGNNYVIFKDTYPNLGKNYIEGVNEALYRGFVYINNNNFWNASQDNLERYNGYYEDYICENNAASIYYVPAQMSEYIKYSGNNVKYPNWKVTLIRETIPSVS